VFENTPLARRVWTGLDDEHLASIGFVNFAWNALERKFASLVWVTAGWTQEVGELVVASTGNVSLVTLFINLLKQELTHREDRRIWEQGSQTGELYDEIRAARNDLIHSFFYYDATTGLEGHFKSSTRKSKTGQAELRTVAMAKNDIDELCAAISDCFESIDDLMLKIWFRRRLLRAKRATSSQAYQQTVHGWQDPPFDLKRLRVYPARRDQGRSPQPASPQAGAPPPGDQRAHLGVPRDLVEAASRRRERAPEPPPPDANPP
jgi:hypothetical protein